MKKSLFLFAVAAVATLLLSGTRVWADPIGWSFTALPITDASGTPYPTYSTPGPPPLVGNLLPAWVKVACIDISPATVTKLMDRGSTQTVGIVSDAEPFLRSLVAELDRGGAA